MYTIIIIGNFPQQIHKNCRQILNIFLGYFKHSYRRVSRQGRLVWSCCLFSSSASSYPFLHSLLILFLFLILVVVTFVSYIRLCAVCFWQLTKSADCPLLPPCLLPLATPQPHSAPSSRQQTTPLLLLLPLPLLVPPKQRKQKITHTHSFWCSMSRGGGSRRIKGRGVGKDRGKAKWELKLTAPSTASHSTFLNIFNCCASFHGAARGVWGGQGVWGVRVDIRLALCSVWLIFWLVYGLCSCVCVCVRKCVGVVGSLVFFSVCENMWVQIYNMHISLYTHTHRWA